MANGRTFRPGPRVEYSQRRLIFDDDTLSTTEIATPLDVAYAPGGTRWRQHNSGEHRPNATAAYCQRHNYALGSPDVIGTVTATQDDDVAAITGTFTDPAYGDGGARVRAQSSVYRRLASRLFFLPRRFLVSQAVTATVNATQDDDTTAVTGTFVAPTQLPAAVTARRLWRIDNRRTFEVDNRRVWKVDNRRLWEED